MEREEEEEEEESLHIVDYFFLRRDWRPPPSSFKTFILQLWQIQSPQKFVFLPMQQYAGFAIVALHALPSMSPPHLLQFLFKYVFRPSQYFQLFS